MGEYIPMRTALGRIEAKLLVDWDVSIERPIALGNHPLIAHLLDHDTSVRVPFLLGFPVSSPLQPVKGCKLCALLKAHQLLSDAIAEDEGLPDVEGEDVDPEALDGFDALHRWLRGEDLDP